MYYANYPIYARLAKPGDGYVNNYPEVGRLDCPGALFSPDIKAQTQDAGC